MRTGGSSRAPREIFEVRALTRETSEDRRRRPELNPGAPIHPTSPEAAWYGASRTVTTRTARCKNGRQPPKKVGFAAHSVVRLRLFGALAEW